MAAPASTSVSLAITTLAGTAVSSVPSGTAVALTATVTSTAGTPYPGQVTFCDATAAFCQNATLGLAQLVKTGSTASATLRFTPGPGAHSYKAVFLGTKSYAGASSISQTLTVSAAGSTTTTLAATGSAGNYTLSAQLSAIGNPSLTGTVSFLDTTTNVPLGNSPVGSGAATFSLGSRINNPIGGPFTADLNGDGKLDVVGLSVEALLGNGDGTFATVPYPAMSSGAAAEGVGDFNNDGKLDVIFATSTAVSLLTGNGDGSFNSVATPLPACNGNTPSTIAVGDFNNDGNADILISCYLYTATILLGNGDGTFSSSKIQAYPVPLFNSPIIVRDFDGDGNADLAVSAMTTSSPFTTYIAFLRGNGDGTFQASISSPVGDISGTFAAADFNGDGKPDLALAMAPVVAAVPQDIGVLLNNGDGTFAAPVLTALSVNYPFGATPTFKPVDLDGDGKADIVLSDQRGLSLLFGKGDGTFTITSTTGQSGNNGPLITGDFNGDGVPDIMAGTPLYLTQETHSASATLASISVGGSGTHSVTATYTGDSAYAASTSSAVSLTATPLATTLALAANPTSSSAGTQVALTATLAPAALGNLNTNGETVTFSSGTTTLGTATLSSGVAALNTTNLPVGTDSITASFPGDTNFSASSAPAAQVTILSPPALALSASSLSFSSQGLTTASAPQTVTLTNSGQSPLTFASVTATGDFAQTNTCTSAPVPAQGTCRIAVTFTPSAGGARTGVVTLTDNALNSPQTISLTGTGAPVATALAVSATPASATFGAPVTLKATLTPATIATLTTNGATITFTSGTATLGTATLTSGIATLTLTSLPVGTDSIAASYPGDANFSTSAAPAASVVVTPPPLPAVTLSISSLTYPVQSANSPSSAQSVTITNSGQAPLTIASITANGDFAQTNTCAATIPVQGTCTIAVTFTPTAAGSRSGTLTLTDNAPNSPQTVSLTGTGAPISVAPAATSLDIATPGGTATTSLQVVAAPGFSGPVALTCAVSSSITTALLPTCVLNPAQGTVSSASPLTSTLTISTTSATARLASPGLPGFENRTTVGLAALLFAGSFLGRSGNRRLRLLTLLLAFGTLAGLVGCGGKSSSAGPTSPGTPAGAYQVTVSAVANAVTVTSTVNLAVQ